MKATGQENPLLAGAAQVDITPEGAVSMGGYGQRAGQVSQGVHDPLSAKALFLTDGKTRLLFLTADLISIPNAIYGRVLAGLTAAGVADPAGICISASHTHSGPDVEEGLMLAAPTRKYLDRLAQALIRVGEEAVARPIPVKLRLATGQVDFLFNRRQMTGNGPVDRRALATSVDRLQDGKPLAVLFGVGCHAVCLGHDNLLISADFPGVAQRTIEREFGSGIALFVNLTEGNVIPATRPHCDSLDTRGYLGGTFEDAEKIGVSLGQEVLRCLAAAPPQPLTHLRAMRRTLTVLPARADLTIPAAWRNLLAQRKIILEYLPEFRKASLLNLRPVFTLWRDSSHVVIEKNLSEAEMRRLMAAVANFLMMAMRLANPAFCKPLLLPVQTVELNEYRFLTLPGEALVEVGWSWQAGNHPHEDVSFVISLSNGFMGYLPHSENFREADAEYKYETIMNALEPKATRIAIEQAMQMIKM